jgi:hypothetical protein
MKDIDQMMKDAGFTTGSLNPTPQPEKVEAPKAEEIKVETPQDKKEDVQADNDKKEEPKSTNDFSIESFNKAFGREYKDIEEVKGLFSQQEEYSKLKAQYEEKEKLISEKDKALQEKFDVMSYFADEQQYVINQVLKNNKGLNKEVITKLVNTNLTDMNDEDVLKLNELLTTKGKFDEAVVARAINKKYGLTVSKEDLDEEGLKDYEVQKFLMKRDADDAREKLAKLLVVDKPEFTDPLKAKQEKEEAFKKEYDAVKNQWSTFAENLVKGLDKYTIEYEGDDKTKKTFEYAFDDNFKKVLKENLPLIAAYNKKDVNKKEDVEQLITQAKKDFLWINQSNIIRNAVEDAMSKATKEELDKYYNPSKPKSDDKPVSLSDEERFNKETDNKLLKDFKIKI